MWDVKRMKQAPIAKTTGKNDNAEDLGFSGVIGQ